MQGEATGMDNIRVGTVEWRWQRLSAGDGSGRVICKCCHLHVRCVLVFKNELLTDEMYV